MDDVKAMTRAGETVGKAVSSGWVAASRSAKRAGQASVEALAEGAETARQEVTRTTRRARRKLAKKAKHTRKDLAKAAKQARKDAARSKAVKQARKTAKQAKTDAKKFKASVRTEAARLKARAQEVADTSPKRKRRWPKLLLLAIIAGGVAYVVRSKAAQQEEPVPTPQPAEPTEPATTPADATQNGQPQKSSTKSS